MTIAGPESAPDYQRRLRLDGRTFVVLGTGGGIGRQTVLALAQAGARVLCVDRDLDLARAAAAEVDGVPLGADVTVRDDIERVFREAHTRGGSVSGLVDVVGQAHLGPLADMDDARWRWQLDIVLTHAFLAMQIGGRAIAEAGGGSMVFVGSMSGLGAVAKQSAYGAAKAALHHLVTSMGTELAGASVRVNAVAPGFVRNPRMDSLLGPEQWRAVEARIPRGAAADPSEIASAILFLASDLSSSVTGQVLTVDGGLSRTIQLPDVWPDP